MTTNNLIPLLKNIKALQKRNDILKIHILAECQVNDELLKDMIGNVAKLYYKINKKRSKK